MSDEKELPRSLRQISELPEVKEKYTYGTLRTYSSKYSSFPKPAVKNIAGKGMLWYGSEVIEWLKLKPDNRGKGQVDPSARAIKGHKNRLIRKSGICSANCGKPIVGGDEVIETVLPNHTQISVFHIRCAIIHGHWDEEDA